MTIPDSHISWVPVDLPNEARIKVEIAQPVSTNEVAISEARQPPILGE
ncbi:MAG: hypothetical protein ACFB0C_20380 [Leptolyngbyaceae cyanobacterium]